MSLCTPSKEAIFQQFRTCRGLYVLGAGVSAGHVPLSNGLLRAPALDYVRGGCFPAFLPSQSELTKKSVAATTGSNLTTTLSILFPNRTPRPGTEEFPLEEMLRRMPDLYTLQHMRHALAKPRFLDEQSDNYLVFRHFHPSVILNYNHDGLASYLCRPHKVVVPHGTVESWYGSPQMADYPKALRDFDLPVPPATVTPCVPESESDSDLKSKIYEAVWSSLQFLALIGYSFSRIECSCDQGDSSGARCARSRSTRSWNLKPSPQRSSMANRLTDPSQPLMLSVPKAVPLPR
jgi:hypothetical protein